ncbi:MAG: hypothetical protein JXB47_02170, partial [Anaerolineae bacterium]|nr:hypothetical protein [Anaerolineae bacterium]
MAKLTRAARNEIVDLISPFIETSEERQALLKDALIDTSALGNIDYSGPIREFAIHLISELASYGTVEQDKYALWALLETVRGRVGGDKQARIDALRDIVNAEIEVEPDARPEAPTSSPAWFNSFVLLMRVVVGVIALVMLVASGAWLFVDPGFEPLLGVLGGVIGLLAAFEALAETLVKRLPINLMVIAFIVVVALVMLGGSSAIVTQQNALATATQVIQSAQATADVAQEQARRNLLSSLALRASLPVNVDDLANVPSALAIAPGGDAPAVWGYGEANGALFAIDTTTGAPLPVWEGGYIFPLRPELSESFRPSALHFDGEWLWIGDSTGQQVVALDPATLAEQVRWSPGGVPVAITSADGALWVALGDLDKLVAVTFDRDTGEPSPHCPRERLTIGEAPSTLAAEGGVAVWVGYGRGEAGAVRRVSVQGCEAGEPVTLGARPAQLAASDDVLWAVVEGGALYRIDTATQEAVRVELPGLEVKAVLPAGDKLWVADAAGPSLVVLDLETGAARLTIPLNAPPLALARHGAQVWLSTGDDFVTQFIAPEYVHPGLVDVVGAEGALWLVDTGGNL